MQTLGFSALQTQLSGQIVIDSMCIEQSTAILQLSIPQYPPKQEYLMRASCLYKFNAEHCYFNGMKRQQRTKQ
ncbi:hypothetical protein T11_3369 [Trichinella zimbabwensis]|uniref:Uncharacterized protein n=1 Tax=Trichinella zimbabwensis TaxID=268475 RepID=A0A0V1HS33_9BILA|nr:hypothetical protein T11_3369 [Trichinella zimbabwensis]